MNKNLFRCCKKILLLVLFTAIAACGGGGGGADPSSTDELVGNTGQLTYSPESCSDDHQLKFINEVMHDVYYWSSSTPILDYASYTSQESLLHDLRYSADDWSYLISQQDYLNYYTGSNTGLGVKLTYSSSLKEIYITLVYPDSPADLSGLQRGYKILNVNGYTAADIIDNDLWSDAFGPDEAGYTVNLAYVDNNSSGGTAAIVKDNYYADSSPTYNIFTNSTNSKKIGYLLYLNFSGTYLTDLSEAMTEFEKSNIRELIIDLRYNGGGQNSAARYLGSVIAGAGLFGKLMYSHIHNEKYSPWDRETLFSSSIYSLKIEKVVFIVTSQTASASELLINSLSPYMDVTVVGGKTHGKPVGMYAFGFCEKYLVPITFEMQNSDSYGGYYSGFTPDCSAGDDIEHQLGDKNEDMLQTAVGYLETNNCSVSAKKLKTFEHVKRDSINKIFNSY